MSDRAGAVFDVKASEATLNEAQVVDALRRGHLRSTDLVQVDGVWSTLADSMPFGDEASKLKLGEGLGRTAKSVLMAAAALLAFGGALVLRLALRMLAHH
jgi:hypothetical protein